VSTRATKVPAIPAPTNANDLDFKKSIKSVLDVREGLAGDPLDANVTVRDLNDVGFLSRTSVSAVGTTTVVGLPPGYVPPDLTPPPAPTGLASSATITSIFLSWGSLPVGYAGNHGFTEVWRSATNVLGSAVMIGTSNSMFYVDALGSTGTGFYYWIRYRSAANVTGPYNAVSGVFGQTGLIGNVDLGPLIIEAGNLAAGAVDATKFVSSIQPITIVLGALPTVLSTRAIFLASDGKLYRWNGTAYVATVLTADLVGTIADAQIAALSAAKITGTLTDSQIADLSAAKLTGSITSTQIANDSITTPKIFAGAITTAKIAADAVTANEIAANAVTAAKINAGAVTAAKIAANTITAGQIAANTITAAQILANTITAAEIAADTITAGQIAAGAITAGKIAANAIAVGSAAIQNGAIVNAMIANATIDSAKVSSLSAALLTAGDGTIGGNLKSETWTAGSGSTPGVGWIITRAGNLYASSATIYGTIYATAGVFSGQVLVGSTPSVSGTTMTGSGAVLNADGSFSLGNSTSNITRAAGGGLTLNGPVVATSNIQVGAVTNGLAADTGGFVNTNGLTTDTSRTSAVIDVATITTTGQPVVLHGTALINISPSNAAVTGYTAFVSLFLNGSAISGGTQHGGMLRGASLSTTICIPFLHRGTPASGSNIYQYQIQVNLNNAAGGSETFGTTGGLGSSVRMVAQESKV
jgi:hypothetical protein